MGWPPHRMPPEGSCPACTALGWQEAGCAAAPCAPFVVWLGGPAAHPHRDAMPDPACPAWPPPAQPKQIEEIKEFLLTARRKDARSVKIKKSGVTGVTKFKVRCSRYLYTLCITDSDKAEKLKQSLPPGAWRAGGDGAGRCKRAEWGRPAARRRPGWQCGAGGTASYQQRGSIVSLHGQVS